MWFDKLFAKLSPEDTRLSLPAVEAVINHRLKVVMLFDYDSDMPDDRYDLLRAHLAKQGYFLHVTVASVNFMDRMK